jgi:septal ring factor EnvC (AmiA/AmiB activator)
MDMDEATRYQSAFAMAKTMGATPKKLLETANHYLNILKTEEQKFGQALVSQKDKQIGNRQQRLDQLAKSVEHKRKQIAQLTKEIETHEQESAEIKQQITDSTVKVENTKNNFVVTYQLLTSQIKEDISKMQSYLK